MKLILALAAALSVVQTESAAQLAQFSVEHNVPGKSGSSDPGDDFSFHQFHLIDPNLRSEFLKRIKTSLSERRVLDASQDVALAVAFCRPPYAWGIVGVSGSQLTESNPESYIFYAESLQGRWLTTLEYEEQFRVLICNLPEDIMGKRLKRYLCEAASFGDDPPLLGLPWSVGVSWRLTGGPHSNGNGNRPWSSLDFNIAPGQSGTVRAARDGVAFLPCPNFVRIDHGDGWQTGYYHLTSIAVVNGQVVNVGQTLGLTSTEAGCDGSANGPHVHFSLRLNNVHQEMEGKNIGGWIVHEGANEYEGYMTKNGITRYVGDYIENDGMVSPPFFWSSRYSGTPSGEDTSWAVAIGPGNSVYVTGGSQATSSFDLTTVKYNSSGSLEWVRNHNGPGNGYDIGWDVAVDEAGNAYVCGDGVGAASGLDFVTIKYNSTGEQQWVRRYDGPSNRNDYGYDVVLDNSNNVIVTGWSQGASTDLDFATIKYDDTGVEQWRARYDGPASMDDRTWDVKVDPSANVFVAGSSVGIGSNSDATLVKYSQAGVQQWVARYDGPVSGFDLAYGLAVDRMGNSYITGYSDGGFSNGPDCITIKYSPSGVRQWAALYNGPTSSADWGFSVTVDDNGNVFVAGASQGDYLILKYNASGSLQWAERYDGPGNGDDVAWDVVADRLGNVYVTGASWSGSSTDYAVIKYSTAGVRQWVSRYDGTGNGRDFSFDMAIDNVNNICVTGFSEGSTTSTDFATVKYLQSGITSVRQTREIPTSFLLRQNYPNPFNPTTTIEFALPKSSRATLKVFDLLGREVATVVDENLPVGVHKAEWNAGGFSSGVYLYRLQAGDFVETKKLLLLR